MYRLLRFYFLCCHSYSLPFRLSWSNLSNGTDRYTEKYEYYAGGKLKKVTFADGTSESYEYDSSWRLTKVTDELENSLVTTYDSSGNVLSVTDAEGNKTQYTYDKYGRMLTATDANGNVIFIRNTDVVVTLHCDCKQQTFIAVCHADNLSRRKRFLQTVSICVILIKSRNVRMNMTLPDV